MLDQLNGDCETREERLRKIIEEQGKAHQARAPPPKRSSPTVSPRNEGLNDIQTKQVEEMIALSRHSDMQTRNGSLSQEPAKDASPDAVGSNDGSL